MKKMIAVVGLVLAVVSGLLMPAAEAVQYNPFRIVFDDGAAGDLSNVPNQFQPLGAVGCQNYLGVQYVIDPGPQLPVWGTPSQAVFDGTPITEATFASFDVTGPGDQNEYFIPFARNRETGAMTWGKWMMATNGWPGTVDWQFYVHDSASGQNYWTFAAFAGNLDTPLAQAAAQQDYDTIPVAGDGTYDIGAWVYWGTYTGGNFPDGGLWMGYYDSVVQCSGGGAAATTRAVKAPLPPRPSLPGTSIARAVQHRTGAINPLQIVDALRTPLRHGKPFVIADLIKNVHRHRIVTTGRIMCRALVGKHHYIHQPKEAKRFIRRNHRKNGFTGCGYVLPRNSRGKRFVVQVQLFTKVGVSSIGIHLKIH